jgi:hypothetical protein
MLTDGELAAMQDAAASVILTDEVVVERRGRVPDGEGGFTLGAPVDVYRGKGSVEVAGLTPQEQDIAGRYQVSQMFAIQVPAGTDVRATDRVLWSGHTYEVIGPRGPTTVEILREVLVVEVT